MILSRFSAAIFGTSLLVACTGAHPAPQPSPVPLAAPPPQADPPAPSGKLLLGAYDARGIAALEAQLGTKLAIDMRYPAYGDPLANAAKICASGHIPFMKIGATGVTAAAILNGSTDKALITEAQTLANSHCGQVILGLFPEMTNNGYYQQFYGYKIEGPNMPKAAATYIQVWQHIYKFLHASNVQLAWTPSGDSFGKGNVEQFYPGDAFVDWIGEDLYDKASAHDDVVTDVEFINFYRWSAPHGKPLFFGETGAIGAAQVLWCKSMLAFKTSYPAMRAVIWRSAGSGTPHDWTLTGSGLAAFKAVAD